ncbi:hypothetical protein PAAG_04714 [Paracoccidioides lutzii Pb01]|uniref:Uncharacterized protein n=1 Tax=Paracoccidioides lutzii (strain ATCC MYA-826 / Pb01) TaxID=502779 RepID=C1H285_PARBA|nr:hypothetical protein PAAG_04714 [Paracoccidioides lutzii Pb01]EEH33665.2 hypothetical protein PAAG_04714 [Paracoccidioides lutzii Pb01]
MDGVGTETILDFMVIGASRQDTVHGPPRRTVTDVENDQKKLWNFVLVCVLEQLDNYNIRLHPPIPSGFQISKPRPRLRPPSLLLVSHSPVPIIIMRLSLANILIAILSYNYTALAMPLKSHTPNADNISVLASGEQSVQQRGVSDTRSAISSIRTWVLGGVFAGDALRRIARWRDVIKYEG